MTALGDLLGRCDVDPVRWGSIPAQLGQRIHHVRPNSRTCPSCSMPRRGRPRVVSSVTVGWAGLPITHGPSEALV